MKKIALLAILALLISVLHLVYDHGMDLFNRPERMEIVTEVPLTVTPTVASVSATITASPTAKVTLTPVKKTSTPVPSSGIVR